MGSTTEFPLVTEKLPKLVVDRVTIAVWTQTAKHEIAALMADQNSWYYKGAADIATKRCIYNKKAMQGFTCSPEGSRKSEFFLQGILKVSLEDIAYGLYCDSTDEQRTVNAYLDEEYFLDAAVLQVFERRTAEDPFHFAGVKWAAYNPPPGVMTQYSDPEVVTQSDFVYFEYSCKTRDAAGHVVLVQYITSPPLLPGQLSEYHSGLARGKNTQINTFRFMNEGTHCQSSGTFEAGKAVPAWVSMKSVLQAFSNTTNLVGLADARAISNLGKTHTTSTIKVCYLCKKKFGMMRARLNCYSCGQCICRQCAVKQKFFNEKGLRSANTPIFVEDKFCLQCVRVSREQRPESGSFCELVDSISSEESDTSVRTSLDEDHPQHYNKYDFSDLYDDMDDMDDMDEIDDSPTRARQYMKHPGARHSPSASSASSHVHQPVYTDENVSIKGSSRLHQQRQCRPPQKPREPSPLSPVEAYLARAKAEKEKAEKKKQAAASPTADSVSPRRTSQPPPKPFSGPGSEVFSKLSQSIAAQEALLQSIQQEAQKLQRRRTDSYQYESPSNSPSARSPQYTADEGRFEIISEAQLATSDGESTIKLLVKSGHVC
ncbi:hypothetical protein FI667_g12744, partial [Globisporangium splendens]